MSDSEVASQQLPQISVLEMQRHAPRGVEGRAIPHSDKVTIIKARFEAALIALIVCLNLAFSTVESVWFISLLSVISNLVGSAYHLPTSHNTIASWVKQSCREKKTKIKALLAKSRSRVHLSFDIWTSGNHHAFTAVVAHFCSPLFAIESILIGFR